MSDKYMDVRIIGLGILLLLVILYYGLNSYFSGETSFHVTGENTVDYKSIRNGQSDMFTYVILMRMDKMESDISYNIINRQSELSMFVEDGALKVGTYLVDTSGVLTNDLGAVYTLMEHFPMNRWVHLAVSIGSNKRQADVSVYTYAAWEYGDTWDSSTDANDEQKKQRSVLDLYIDGKLLKSMSVPYYKVYYRDYIDDTSDDYSLTVDDADLIIGSPDGIRMIDAQRWDYRTTPQQILDNYTSVTRRHRWLGDYGIDISFFQDNLLSKRFTVI